MKIIEHKTSDGQIVEQYVPENAADRATIAAQMKASPKAWDNGERPEERELRIDTKRPVS